MVMVERALLTWEDNGGGSMGPNTLLRLGGKCVGHLYEDAAKGIDGDQVRDDIAIRYNAHDALIAALEAMRKEFREADLPYGSSAYLQSGAALALARK